MMKLGWISRLPNQCSTRAMVKHISGGIGVALLLMMSGRALAQADQAPAPGVQDGYAVHNTVDLGGHIAGISGSGSMYDTLVNIHSGPRVLGQTFTMHALPGTKHGLFDDLSAFSAGFGGDPNNFAKMDISKGKLYEFSGLFRRDRQYFDYDLLGNPDTAGQTIPYGLVNGVPTTAALAWPENYKSPVMFNTVRRMTDTSLTILPLSKITFRVAYSQNIFQGPTLSPARSVGKYDALDTEYMRNSTDDFTGAIDWKPLQHTKVTFEEQVDHYKADSYFTLNPSDFVAQEADGTAVSFGDWDALSSPYSISACNTGSMGSAYSGSGSTLTYTILTAPQTPGGLPTVNPACDVITSYLRSQPTRILTPTEMLRFQSSSIKNIAMNGDFRFTNSNSNLPHYYETWTGLDGVIRSSTTTGIATAQRQVISLDYGITWEATKTISLSDQVDFSNSHQPGTVTLAGSTLNTPNTVVAGNNGFETINYPGTLTAGAIYSVTGDTNGTAYGYFGQKFLTNSATATWDASSRATLSLTYRYKTHIIGENDPHSAPLAVAAGTANSGTVTINENAGILNAALRPTIHWDINGTAEISYSDNAFTPMSPRQLQHYRVHTLYRPNPWATISGAFNDLERHNNTNNNQASVAAAAAVATATTNALPYDGPLQHVDHSRIVSLGVVLAPNEHYGFDFNYSYSDVYISTNACYSNGTPTTSTSAPTFPGAASTNSTGGPNLCPNKFSGGVLNEWGPVKDFMDAPTQYASMSLAWTPVKTVHSDIGYRISAVSGNQFFNDAQQVNGSLQSAYQSPYVNLAWTVKPGWIWRAEYNYYGYGEGGPSGAKLCSTYTTPTAAVVPCNTLSLTGVNEPSSGLTAPRNFHANNVTLGMHYEF